VPNNVRTCFRCKCLSVTVRNQEWAGLLVGLGDSFQFSLKIHNKDFGKTQEASSSLTDPNTATLRSPWVDVVCGSWNKQIACRKQRSEGTYDRELLSGTCLRGMMALRHKDNYIGLHTQGVPKMTPMLFCQNFYNQWHFFSQILHTHVLTKIHMLTIFGV